MQFSKIRIWTFSESNLKKFQNLPIISHNWQIEIKSFDLILLFSANSLKYLLGESAENNTKIE